MRGNIGATCRACHLFMTWFIYLKTKKNNQDMVTSPEYTEGFKLTKLFYQQRASACLQERIVMCE